MGITIGSENFSADMGYGGFGNFRKKIAVLTNPEFGEHYSELDNATFIIGDARKEYFEKYDAKTKELTEKNIVSWEVANFCYQSDCGGDIDQDQAKQIYAKIKDYDDDVLYGYSGRPDCAMFSDLKNIFKDCAENGGIIEWS